MAYEIRHMKYGISAPENDFAIALLNAQGSGSTYQKVRPTLNRTTVLLSGSSTLGSVMSALAFGL
jgi:hypothetical protein